MIPLMRHLNSMLINNPGRCDVTDGRRMNLCGQEVPEHDVAQVTTEHRVAMYFVPPGGPSLLTY